MSVKFETIKAGDRLFDVRRPTSRDRFFSRSDWSVWTLQVLEIDHEAGTALVSWNCNPPQKKTRSYFAQPNIRRKLPEEKPRSGAAKDKEGT